MADKTSSHLLIAILQFLESEKQSSSLSKEAKESIHVAAECLEEAYQISLAEDAAKYSLPASLPEIFKAGLEQKGGAVLNSTLPEGPAEQANTTPPTQEEKEEADRQKNQGNEFMKQEKYQDALSCYTSALEKDGQNAVYYCNRAAAYSKLDKHDQALQDCMNALQIDPNYSKAYGRKGLAHAALNQHQEAKGCYEKALILDPTNSSYKNNLDLTEEKLRDQAVRQVPGAAGAPNPFGGIPGMDGMGLGSFLQNPALMNMAANMMQNPQMQQMMAGLMQGAGEETAPAGGGPQGIGNLLQAGQQLADQMEQSNPDLVNQLRSQWGAGRQDGEGPKDPPNPPDSSAEGS